MEDRFKLSNEVLADIIEMLDGEPDGMIICCEDNPELLEGV